MASQVDAGSNPPLPLFRPPQPYDHVIDLAKPKTRWGQIADESKELTFLICRITGLFFLIVGSVSLTIVMVRCLFTFSWSSDTEGVYALIVLISAVCRSVFRYFGNTKEILKLRKEVESIIEKSPLATIRAIYPSENVISNAELNLWARYFLHAQPFELFFRNQWSTIFDFKVDEKTQELIKKKYLYRIFHPSSPNNLGLFSEVLRSRLFTDDERSRIKAIQENIRKLQITSLDDARKKFSEFVKEYAEVKNDPNLSTLPPDQFPVYAWLFTLVVWSHRKMGIRKLEKKFEFELQLFSPHFQQPLQQYLADRSAERGLTYEAFKVRNKKFEKKDSQEEKDQEEKDNGLGFITHLPRFLSLVLQADLGLVKTEEIFKERIEYFGAEEQVTDAVLTQEWDHLATMTYEKIRRRNGEAAIKSVKGQKVRAILARKFLELPPRELVKTEYEGEIEALGIDPKSIETRLSQTWGEMKFIDILALKNQQAQKSILAFAKSRVWGKEKAKKEIAVYLPLEVLDKFQRLFDEQILKYEDYPFAQIIKDYPIGDVLEKFQRLFDGQILNFGHYPFAQKLDSLSSPEIIEMIQKHGAFIGKVGWFQMRSHALVKAVCSFLKRNKTVFLFVEKLPEKGVWEFLHNFTLFPVDLMQIRTETKMKLEIEAERHQKKLADLELKHEAANKRVPVIVKQRRSEAEETTKKSKATLDRDEKELKELQKKEKEAEEKLKTWQTNLERKQEEHQTKSKSLGDKKQKKYQLDQIPGKLEHYEKKRLAALKVLIGLEEALKKKNSDSPAVVGLQEKKKELEDACADLEDKLGELRDKQFVMMSRSEDADSSDSKKNEKEDSDTAYTTFKGPPKPSGDSPSYQGEKIKERSTTTSAKTVEQKRTAEKKEERDKLDDKGGSGTLQSEGKEPPKPSVSPSSPKKQSRQEQLTLIATEITESERTIVAYKDGIRQKGEEIQRAIEDFSNDGQYKIITAKIAKCKKRYQEAETLRPILEAACRDLPQLEAEIPQLSRQVSELEAQEKGLKDAIKDAKKEREEKERMRDVSWKAYEAAEANLTKMKGTLATTLFAEEDNQYKQNQAEEKLSNEETVAVIKREANTSFESSCDPD